jgi:hypothetical protein
LSFLSFSPFFSFSDYDLFTRATLSAQGYVTTTLLRAMQGYTTTSLGVVKYNSKSSTVRQ